MSHSTLPFILFSITLTFCFISCGDNPRGFDPNIGGIVMTDINGELIGSTDTDGDWQIGQDWEDEENDLFEMSNLEGCNFNQSNVRAIAYPNPTPDIVNIYIDTEEQMKASHFRIVDEDFDLVGIAENNEQETIAFSLLMLGDPGIYRLYFIIEFDSGCIEKGFGDIQLRN